MSASVRTATKASAATMNVSRWSGVLILIRSARTSARVSISFSAIVLIHKMTRAGPTVISVTAWATMNSTRPCFATIALIRVMGSTMFAQVYRAMACVTLLPTALANSKPTPSATAAVNTPSTMRSVALSMGRAPIAIT